MAEERAETQNITLYPNHIQKVHSYMERYTFLRKFSQAIQYIIDQAPQPPTNGDSAQPQPDPQAEPTARRGGQ
jgi:hypothetical protein